MDYRKSYMLMWALFLVGIPAALIAAVTGWLWLGWLGVVCVVIGGVQNCFFFRCPYCKKHLGRDGIPEYCPHCGNFIG